jgi:hypothetical protein
MVTRKYSWAGIAGILLLFVTVAAIGQRSRYDPAAGQQSGQQSKPRQGFLDFALKQINPGDQDWGECIAEARQFAVEQTIQNSLFWSNLTAIGMLFLSVAVVVFQSKESKRRELIVATCLAEYHNDLVRARRTAYDSISRYNALVEAEARNTQPSRQLPEPASRKEIAGKDAPPRTAMEDRPTHPTSAGANVQTAAKSANKPPRPLRSPEQQDDLIAKVNALQHRVTAAEERAVLAEEREQNLRQKLRQYERGPDEEDDQNRGPKSA